MTEREWTHDEEMTFDETVVMGLGYDWFGWEMLRQECVAPDGSRYAVWPNNNKWSAYGGPDGNLAMERFNTEEEAKAAVDRWIREVV